MEKKSKKQRIHELEMENLKLRTEMICIQADKIGLSSEANRGWVPTFRKTSEFKNYVNPVLLNIKQGKYDCHRTAALAYFIKTSLNVDEVILGKKT